MATTKENLEAAKVTSQTLFGQLNGIYNEFASLIGARDQIAKELEAKKAEFGALLKKIEDAKATHAGVVKATSVAQEAKAAADRALADAKGFLADLKAKL